MIDNDDKNSRSELPFAIAHTGAADGLTEKTRQKYVTAPEKILEVRLADLLTRIVDSIAEDLPAHIRLYLRDLMVAWMKQEKDEFKAWMKQHPPVLQDALDGAERRLAEVTKSDEKEGEAKLVVGYLVILGLANLYKGAYVKDSAKSRAATDLARTHWHRAYELGMQYNVLSEYLQCRITLWLACAEYNAVDTKLKDDSAVREALAKTLSKLNLIPTLAIVRKTIPDDCGPVFNQALLMAVMRKWREAAEAMFAIETLAGEKAQDADFQARKEEFDEEPILELEAEALDEALKTLKAEHQQKADQDARKRRK